MALAAEAEGRPGITLTYIINEGLRTGLRVPKTKRLKAVAKRHRTLAQGAAVAAEA